MRAIEVLREEHQIIERMLSVFEEALDQFEAGMKIRVGLLNEVIDFFLEFADQSHYKKEEDILFVGMQKGEVSFQNGPIDVMLMEHEMSRVYIQSIKDAVDRLQEDEVKALMQLVENGRNFLTLFHGHIAKENHILFPIAERLIPLDRQEQVLEGFNRIEPKETAKILRRKYITMADRLESELLAIDSFL